MTIRHVSKQLLDGEFPVVGMVHDPIKHPDHYTSHPSGVECITIAQEHTFNIGNAIKYLWRAGIKDQDAHIQDLEKAIQYIKFEIKRLQK